MTSTPHVTDHEPDADSDAQARDILLAMGLIDPSATPALTPLSGGVSSDIWLVETEGTRCVLKRPKHQLKVASTWIVPVDRGQAELEWLTWVGEHFPDNVPQVLGFHEESFSIALSFFPPHTHSNWKSDLMAGSVDVRFAAELGQLLAGIHSASSNHPGLAPRFSNHDLFYSLRIEPFLMRTQIALPQVADRVEQVIASLNSTTVALVHGDFSPKNILVDHTVTPSRPIVLDAECGVWGDPAFDVAFCLTHLALKSVHVRGASDNIIDAANQFLSSYLAGVDDDLRQGVTKRLTALLPSLLLARIVGGSPAGYLSAEDEARVTDAAVTALVAGEPCGALLHPGAGNRGVSW